MMRRLFLGMILLLAPVTAQAHEFMVVPSAGQPADISLIMTEDWIQPDRVPPVDKVRLERISASGRSDIPVVPAEKRLAATLPATEKGPVLLAAGMVRDRMEKPKGRPAEGAPPPVERMTRSASYSKSFVNLTAVDDLWAKPVGSRLEVMPLSNPATLKPGQTLSVQVLFDGKPVEAMVQATYDAGGQKGHGFVVRTKAGADGKADIPVDRGGLWLVRAKYGLEENREGYVYFAGSANLTFRVF